MSLNLLKTKKNRSIFESTGEKKRGELPKYSKKFKELILKNKRTHLKRLSFLNSMDSKELGKKELSQLRPVFQNTHQKFLQTSQNICFLTHQQLQDNPISFGQTGVTRRTFHTPVFSYQKQAFHRTE